MEDSKIEKNNGLKYKAETILKHKLRLTELKDRKARDKLKSRQIYKEKLNLKRNIKKPEDFVRDYRRRQKNYADYKMRKNKKPALQNEMDKVFFVLRIRGNKNLSKPQSTILKRMGLKKIHEAHFFKNTDETRDNLKRLENHVVFGALDVEVARELITKRSFIKTATSIEPVTSNKLIEDVFGKEGMISIEDVAYELIFGGTKFDQIKEKIRTYKINKPTNGYGDKLKPYTKGGVWGYHLKGFSDFISSTI